MSIKFVVKTSLKSALTYKGFSLPITPGEDDDM